MSSEMVDWGAFSGAITVVSAPRDIAPHDLAALHRAEMVRRLSELEPHDIGVGEMFLVTGEMCSECGEANLTEFADPNVKGVCVFCTDKMEESNGL